MEAIILAGGFGSRLREVVSDLPKPMAPIAGKPFLEILLDKLNNDGFTHVVLSVGHLHQKITDHFGAKYKSINISYEIESTPLGTGGAVMASIKHCKEDHVFVFNGDTYLEFNVATAELMWCKDRKPLMLLKHVTDASRYGLVQVNDNVVVSFTEKGASSEGLINAGCYVLPRHIFEGNALGSVFSMENDFLPLLLANGGINGFVTQGKFIDIGIRDDYELAQTYLLVQ